MSSYTYSFLALGDSYTIGEGVPLHESFPYQAVQILRKEGHPFHAPEIVAKTGWTTSELKEQIAQTSLHEKYDFVSLLIGVNNQYWNLSLNDYKIEFKFLLNKAIELAGDKAKNVIVLSIPDWGVSPFAEGRDAEKIAKEIDMFNEINKEITGSHVCHYIDITKGSRLAQGNPTSFVEDKLHPSGAEYKRWALEVARVIKERL
jgi:lysophospholipase L1-like esterase